MYSTTNTWSAFKRPEAFVTKGKKRIKQFDGQVYLADGDEYEIELFNPTQEVVLAKIKIDGDYIAGGGIVLRRGERVFLERFLDSPHRFKYLTYVVNENNTDVQDAIRNNGYVEIEFYSEYKPTFPNRTIYSGNTNSTGTINGIPITFTTTGNSGNFSLTSGTTTTSTFYNASLTANTFEGPNIRNLSNKVETGTTEKGGGSDQTFEHTNKTFNQFSFWNVAWQILPVSQKQYTAEEVGTNYCGNCGAKRKKSSFKFCPQCGTKF
jgi:hypothetical protein